MKLRRFYATQAAKEHMRGKHGVAWEEALEVLEQDLPIRRSRSGPGAEKRYYVDGATEDGRRLRVIVALEPPHTARVVTAYEVR